MLHRIEAFDDNEEELTRAEMMQVLKTVLSTISKYDPKFPLRQSNHADIVKECTRLLVKDTIWHKTIETNKNFAKDFYLDSLISSEDANIKKIGEAMGSLLMVKIPNLELDDIVDEDYSMEKINQALLKYLINTQVKFRLRVEHAEHDIEELHERCTEIEELQDKAGNVSPGDKTQKVVTDDLKIKLENTLRDSIDNKYLEHK